MVGSKAAGKSEIKSNELHHSSSHPFLLAFPSCHISFPIVSYYIYNNSYLLAEDVVAAASVSRCLRRFPRRAGRQVEKEVGWRWVSWWDSPGLPPMAMVAVAWSEYCRRESTSTAGETACSSSSSHHSHSFGASASIHNSGKSCGHNCRLCNGCRGRIDSTSNSSYYIFGGVAFCTL